MIEHAVQDHLDAPVVRPSDERLEFRLGTQVGVDGEVVGRVVAVVGGCREDGVEVQRRDAPRGEVVQMGRDARKVAAKEVAAQRLLVAGSVLVGTAEALRAAPPIP